MVVTEYFRTHHGNNIIQYWSWNFRKFDRQLRNRESLPFMNSHEPLHSLLNNLFCQYRLSSLTISIVDIISPFFKHSAPFSYTTITHKIVAINLTHPMMNFGCIMPFSEKKASYYGAQFIIGGCFDYVWHVNTNGTQQWLKGRRLPIGVWQRNLQCGITHGHFGD